MINEVAVMLEVFIAYSIIVIGIPWLVCRQVFPGIDGIRRFFISFVWGNFVIINLVYILAFLKGFNRYTFIIAYAAVYIGILLWVKRKLIADQQEKLYIRLEEIQQGCLKPKQIFYGVIAGWRQKWKQREKMISPKYVSLLAESVLVLVIIFIITAILSSRALTLESFAAPDEEVHLQWIQSLLDNKLFHSGIYPFGMHNIVGAVYQVTGLLVTDVLKFFGVVTNSWSFLVQYLAVRAFCRNRVAPVLAFAVVFLTNLFSPEPLLRLQLPVPHEYALAFVFIMGCFLIWYLESWEKRDLFFFGTGFSLTILIHFHATIVAGIFCVCIGLLFFVYAIRKRLLISILIAGLGAAAAGVWPIGVGVLQGHEFEQSMAWAVSVIQGNDNLSQEEKRKIQEGEEPYYDEAEADLKEVQQEKKVKYSLFSVETLYNLTKHSYSDIKYTALILCILALGVILHFVRLIKVRFCFPDAGRLAFYLFHVVVLVMMVSEAIGLPVLLYPTRLSSYLFFCSCFLLASPWEELYCLMGKIRFLKGIVLMITGGTLIAGGKFVYQNNLLVTYPQHYYFQTTGANRAVSSIIRNYPSQTWTVVSVVTETAMVYRDGFHYEWIDFLDQLKDRDDIVIPTQYVFFIIEKMPIIKFGWAFEREDDIIYNRPSLNRQDAFKELEPERNRDDYYKYQREIVMAKADLWAEEFSRQYPGEMTVYYEDKEVVVYRLVQNNGYNNLSIYQ